MYGLRRGGGGGLCLVGYTTAHTNIPGVEEYVCPGSPGAVSQAHLQHGHPHHPVWGGAQLAHKGHQVAFIVCFKAGEGLAIKIRMPETTRLNDSFDFLAFVFQLFLHMSEYKPTTSSFNNN